PDGTSAQNRRNDLLEARGEAPFSIGARFVRADSLDHETKLLRIRRVEALQRFVLRLRGRALAEVRVADAEPIAELDVVRRRQQRWLVRLQGLGEAPGLDGVRRESLLRVGVIGVPPLMRA